MLSLLAGRLQTSARSRGSETLGHSKTSNPSIWPRPHKSTRAAPASITSLRQICEIGPRPPISFLPRADNRPRALPTWPHLIWLQPSAIDQWPSVSLARSRPSIACRCGLMGKHRQRRSQVPQRRCFLWFLEPQPSRACGATGFESGLDRTGKRRSGTLQSSTKAKQVCVSLAAP
jgi:hypothetical protein